MIVDLPGTTTNEISRRLLKLRNSVGAMAMGRVLTLVIVTDEDGVDDAVKVANDATRQHPARIVILVSSNPRGRNRLDGQIRVGGDAGASEVVVMRLYGQLAKHADSVLRPLLLPDSPIVAWWPAHPPADVADSPIGVMAHRRITDASVAAQPGRELSRRAEHYRPGDTDLSWTRITRWRALLASALDRAPFDPVTDATVTGEAGSPSADLLAGWLADSLDIQVRRAKSQPGTGLLSVRLVRDSGPIDLVLAPEPDVATLSQPGQPTRQVPIARPPLAECLAEELRRLDIDVIYASALQEGRSRIRTAITRAAAIDAGHAPADDQSIAERARLHDDAQRDPDSRVDILPDPDGLARAVAAELVQAVEAAVASDGIAHIALTGGSMGSKTVAALAELELDPHVWQQVHLWWGDERFVPAGDPDRNDQQAEDAGLARLPGVLADHVHRVAAAGPGPIRPTARAAAAALYADDLARYADDPDVPAAGPEFTVVLLGLGPDTHIASLFPGREELRVSDRGAVPVANSPKPPPDRVSLTVPVLRRARQVWFVVAGADKAAAVRLGRRASEDPLIPASWVRGQVSTRWWLDEAAAGED